MTPDHYSVNIQPRRQDQLSHFPLRTEKSADLHTHLHFCLSELSSGQHFYLTWKPALQSSMCRTISASMDLKKQLLSFVRMFLPAVGFALTCIGAYLVYLQTEHSFHSKLVPSYAMIACGFLAMLTGIFWNLYSMRSKMYQRSRRERHIQIFTVAR